MFWEQNTGLKRESRRKKQFNQYQTNSSLPNELLSKMEGGKKNLALFYILIFVNIKIIYSIILAFPVQAINLRFLSSGQSPFIKPVMH